MPTVEQITVPAQNRVRAHHQLELTQLRHRQVVQERRQQRAVARSEHRLACLTVQDSELVPQCQDFHVLVAVAHRQQAYEGEGVRHRKVSQSQHRTNLPPTGHDPAIGPAPNRAIPARRLERPSGR
ncbi:hypothetical protein ACGFSB_04415 [Streptomyces sp. NPDC048441]|uniref:hypothetical protein n=1 Tax=Streptomyces sp. NPDC048441 TaxID=3365552 RepID=UPI00371D060C